MIHLSQPTTSSTPSSSLGPTTFAADEWEAMVDSLNTTTDSDFGLLDLGPSPFIFEPITPAPPIPPPLLNADQLFDELLHSTKLIQTGNSSTAIKVLARLNRQLSVLPFISNPLFRSAFYFKEALLLLLDENASPTSPLLTPLDVLLKLGTCKAFSEISPVPQFTNFTSIQAILEAVSGCDHVHVIDFDVGFGGHWSSFMHELAHCRKRLVPSLKITAFCSSQHPLEMHLTRENLSNFAAELGIPFEFNVFSDPSSLLTVVGPDGAVAVNFPMGSVPNLHLLPSIIRLLRQLNPKIVVSVEYGCDIGSDLPFSYQFLHGFKYSTVLLDSIDASGADRDVINKIEQYLVQPRIETSVLNHHGGFEKTVSWRSMFISAGFLPIQFSNFTETQAECLLKRIQVTGYNVEKREASLYLCWQKGELVSVSAWKCRL